MNYPMIEEAVRQIREGNQMSMNVGLLKLEIEQKSRSEEIIREQRNFARREKRRKAIEAEAKEDARAKEREREREREIDALELRVRRVIGTYRDRVRCVSFQHSGGNPFTYDPYK